MADDPTNRVLEALARRVTGSEVSADPDVDAVLASIPSDALDRYAASLLDKRTGELRRAIPLTVEVVPWVPDVYRAWLGQNPAWVRDTVLPPGLAEALRALHVLVEACEPEWTADLLRFEVYRRATALDGAPRQMRSEWPIHVLAAEVAAGEVPADPEPDPHELRFADRVYHRRAG
jgi:hypothetical protein